MMKTPVVLFIFNRLDTTSRVFEAIRHAKPPKLFVVADGPRIDRLDEVERCAATRAVINRADWNCEVLLNYSDVNLGCKKRVSSGLKWVFNTVEEAIILEDDCLPHPSFFPFCEELLARYRDDERVMAISGQKSRLYHHRTKYSYYFSRYFHCWGWASWRRAFQHYDVQLNLWSEVRDSSFIKDFLADHHAAKYWSNVFQNVYNGNIDTWDYQWMLMSWVQNSLTVIPSVNLISNIGCGPDATHTVSSAHPDGNASTEAIALPLNHPPFIVRDSILDNLIQTRSFSPDFFTQFRVKAKRILSNLLLNKNC